MTRNSNIWADERGNSLIEMAIVAPVLATLMIGAVDLSAAYSAKLAVEQVAQRTIERVQVNSFQTSQKTTFENEAKSAAGTGSSATMTAWLECNGNGSKLDYDTGTCSAGQTYQRYVQITVERPFTPKFGTRFFKNPNANGTVTVRATAGVRLQ